MPRAWSSRPIADPGPSLLPLLLALSAALAGAGCSPVPKPPGPEAAPASAPHGPPIAYRFESLDDRPVSLEGLRGRAAVLAFLTTYGDASTLQARYLKKVLAEHVPRVNAAAVFLEPIENRPLVRLFRDFHRLPFPLAMGDTDSVAGKGPFVGIDTVPSVVVIDQDGREVWRKVGVASEGELDSALRDAQRGVWGQALSRLEARGRPPRRPRPPHGWMYTTVPCRGLSAPCQASGTGGSVKPKSHAASVGCRFTQPWLRGRPKSSCQ